jgi:hypothetical protein
MDLSRFALGNLFDQDFALNKSNITCTLPCKEACDRDSVSGDELAGLQRSPDPPVCATFAR